MKIEAVDIQNNAHGQVIQLPEEFRVEKKGGKGKQESTFLPVYSVSKCCGCYPLPSILNFQAVL